MKNLFIKSNLICPFEFNKSSGKVEDNIIKYNQLYIKNGSIIDE